MKSMRPFFVGLLCALATNVWGQTVYNYFSPGGALSCTGQCTQQNVNVGAGAFVTGTLPNANLVNSSITLNGTSVSLGSTRTLSLASSDFANQGTTTTVLHGNAAGNPSFGAVSLTADVTGVLPLANILTCATTQIVFDSTGNLVCSAQFTWNDATSTLLLGGATPPIIASAAGGTTTAGQLLTLAGGQGGSTSGAGAAVTIQGGAGVGSASGAGGGINILGGAGTAHGTGVLAKGGAIVITGGAGGGSSGSVAAGAVTITGGAGSATAATGAGANITAIAGAGNGTVSGNGGNFNLQGGAANLSGTGGSFSESGGNGATNGAGGGFTLSGGNGAGTGAGGALTLLAGAPGATGNSGLISITGAAAPGGVGSSIVVTPGTGSTTANGGSTTIQSPGGNNTLIIDQFGNVICTCVTTAAATDGFSYLGAVTGAPTGVPAHTTGIYANSIPLRYDTTNSVLWAYNGAWKNIANSVTAIPAHTTYSGSAPTVSACGTGPSIDANATDATGTVTVGTVAAASCTVTFNVNYTTYLHCRVTSQSTIASFAYTYALGPPSTITVTGTSLVGDKFDYQCDGT